MTESELSVELPDDERISKFITNDKHFNIRTKRVRPCAFNPPSTNRLSAYRTTGCDEPEIWSIAQQYVTALRADRATVLARADVTCNVYKRVGLRLNADGIPHQRHVNIEGWPLEDERCQMIKVDLANEATLEVRP